MARYTGPVCRLCRREDQKLYLKGERCRTSKCAMEQRRFPPGERTFRYGRPSEYAIQLREKQKMKRTYGVLEAQFRKIFKQADQQHGITGENLLVILESRLDNVVWRLGIAGSRAQARQFINQGHILVNGGRVDVASYLVDKGDVIETTEKMRENTEVKKYTSLAKQRGLKGWLDLDAERVRGTVLRDPERSDVDEIEFEEQLIVELYSK